MVEVVVVTFLVSLPASRALDVAVLARGNVQRLTPSAAHGVGGTIVLSFIAKQVRSLALLFLFENVARR